MTEEVIKEVITSIPASAEPKCEDLLTNPPLITDASSMPPDVKRKEKPVPHYLRPSTSSCHDNCKYGIKHSSEPKKYRPVRRKQLRRASTGNLEGDRVEILLPQRAGTRKDQELKTYHGKDATATATALAKSELTNPKAPLETLSDHPQSNPYVEELPTEASEPAVDGSLQAGAAECFIVSHDDAPESSDGAESIELEMPLAIQETDESDEHTEDPVLPTEDVCDVREQPLVDHDADESTNENASSEKRTTHAVIASEKQEQAKHGTKSGNSPKEFVKHKAKATSRVTAEKSSNQKGGKTLQHPTSTRTAAERSSGPKTMRKTADANAATNPIRDKKVSSAAPSSAVTKVKGVKAPSAESTTDSSSKSARLPKLKASTAKNTRSSSVPSGKQTDRTMAVMNGPKNAQVLLQKKREEKVVTGPLKLSRSINMSGKLSVSSIKLRSVRKERIAPPIKSSRKVSGTESSAADPKDAKQRILKTASPKVKNPDVNGKESRPRKEKTDTARTATVRRPKPAPTVPPTTAPPQPPRKLTFRRGKVLNPDEGSSATPRRIRFRPAMAAADAAARSRGGKVAGRRAACGGVGVPGKDSGASRGEVVVLRRRHQDGGEETKKKQEQVLLNNVIEETASRLVAEARKSKVKALVGAFETVISLQETGSKAAPPPPPAAAGAVAP